MQIMLQLQLTFCFYYYPKKKKKETFTAAASLFNTLSFYRDAIRFMRISCSLIFHKTRDADRTEPKQNHNQPAGEVAAEAAAA